jgi:hypothetical protein
LPLQQIEGALEGNDETYQEEDDEAIQDDFGA